MTSRRSFLALLGVAPVALLAPRALASSSGSTESSRVPPVAPWTDDPELLARWRQAQRRLVLESSDATVSRLLQAIHAGERIDVRYSAVSDAGALRALTPGAVFTVEGYPEVYLSAFCHERQAIRTFAVSRMHFPAHAGRRTV